MEKAKFFCGIIINPSIEMDVLTEELSLLYGEVDYIGGPLDFSYTSYYEEEFGQNLRRYFISFENLIHPGKLAEIKRETISLEKKFSQKGKRQVNIDPGYMEPSKLVLASTKNFSHRIYIGQGIYAEITLLWRKGKFRDLEWTFPDYRSIEYKLILDKIREIYMNSRR